MTHSERLQIIADILGIMMDDDPEIARRAVLAMVVGMAGSLEFGASKDGQKFISELFTEAAAEYKRIYSEAEAVARGYH